MWRLVAGNSAAPVWYSSHPVPSHTLCDYKGRVSFPGTPVLRPALLTSAKNTAKPSSVVTNLSLNSLLPFYILSLLLLKEQLEDESPCRNEPSGPRCFQTNQLKAGPPPRPKTQVSLLTQDQKICPADQQHS